MTRLATFEGKGAVVTGASSGIGRALAVALGAKGARVGLVARRAERLEAVAREITDAGGVAFVLPCDVSDTRAVERTAREAERRLEGVDLLVNNAGVGRHRLFLEDSLSRAREIFDVNVVGTLAFTRAIAPAMADRGRGWVVFMASIAGLVPVPGEAVYSASKFATIGFAEALSLELEPLGVHVSTICPGSVRTDFAAREADRLVPAAERTSIEPEQVVNETLRALARGRRRVVVPARLGVAPAVRGLFPGLVRRGTRAAVRSILPDRREGPSNE